MLGLTSTLDLAGLDRYVATLGGRIERAVRTTAFDVEARAKARSRIDTGAQANSVYTSIASGASNYDAHRAAAAAAQPDAPFFPEHVPPRVPEGAAAVVAVGVEYGLYNDQGAHGRAGDGFFTRSVEEARAPFAQALREALRGG